MPPLSDAIEAFIKDLLAEEVTQQAQIELRRNELAEYFHCAPSQINYVLATRFTLDHGYLVESRRGGGGYIRIIRIVMEGRGAQLLHLANQRVGAAISEAETAAILSGLLERDLINDGEARLMRAAIGASAVALPIHIKDTLRAATLRQMLLALAQQA